MPPRTNLGFTRTLRFTLIQNARHSLVGKSSWIDYRRKKRAVSSVLPPQEETHGSQTKSRRRLLALGVADSFPLLSAESAAAEPTPWLLVAAAPRSVVEMNFTKAF